MSPFDEWWKKTAHPNFGACEYRVAQSAWNAALLHAAAVAVDMATEKQYDNKLPKRIAEAEELGYRRIAARLRQEAGK